MKKIVSLLLTLMLAVGLLTGCTDPKELYDNEDAIAGGSSAFEALNWAESSLTDDGTIDYTAGATSMVGAKLAFSFTINAKSANVDVYDTISCGIGSCKILFVNTDTKNVESCYLETAYDTIKLNGGNYKVYIVAKDDASFTVTLNLSCPDGNVEWTTNPVEVTDD